MYRHGGRLIRYRAPLGQTRKASTATRLKAEQLEESSQEYASPSPQSSSSASPQRLLRPTDLRTKDWGKPVARKKAIKAMQWNRSTGPPLSELQPKVRMPPPPTEVPAMKKAMEEINNKLNAMRGHSAMQIAKKSVQQGMQTRAGNKSVQSRQNGRKVYLPQTVSVGNLSTILKIRLPILQRCIVSSGITSTPTYDHVLTAEYAALIAEEFGCVPVIDEEAAFDLYPPAPHKDPTSLPLRPPVVTIMGHVDHGKTTLLDTLRSSSVAKGEAGGITQHIGAFSVPVKSQSGSSGPGLITFLDTPGHAAFSAMRARGAGVTDIIVLVVAADDGIMPQTREVIELYKKYSDTVGLVVAINKVDKPAADIEAVEKALMAEGIQLESYGGDIPAVYVSGLTGKGLPELVETLSALAEMQDIRADPTGFAYAEILESRVQKGLGFDATALILRGSLKLGAHILSGSNYAKVRRMTDSTGKTVKVATPGMAVTVSGWKTLPKAGDDVIEGSEADVKKALANRVRKSEIDASLATVEAINEARQADRVQRAEELKAAASRRGPPQATPMFQPVVPQSASNVKELRLLIKADVSGSAEAVEGALQGIGNKIATSKVISAGVGDVTESDVKMAKAANATIVAFSVGVSKPIQQLAANLEVPILTSKIIYKLMDDVRERVRGLLPPIIETKVTGEANVLQLFEIQMKDKSKKQVAGCRVTNGLLEKSRIARVVRNGETVHEGNIDAMKHLKKDVTEVRKGTECGLSFTNFQDLREGDLVQFIDKIEKPGNL